MRARKPKLLTMLFEDSIMIFRFGKIQIPRLTAGKRNEHNAVLNKNETAIFLCIHAIMLFIKGVFVWGDLPGLSDLLCLFHPACQPHTKTPFFVRQIFQLHGGQL